MRSIAGGAQIAVQAGRGALGLLLLTLAACSAGTSDGPGDGGSDGLDSSPADGIAITPPAPPELPAPPVLTPCPPGWREVPPEDPTDPYDVATCDPWPERGVHECAIDEAHFPGEPGCTRIGTACPAGDWAEDLPTNGVLYVLGGAEPGGTGTRDDPFGTIAEATAAATTGTVIALSKGTFDEPVVLPTGVTLWGACVAETEVTCSNEVSADVIRVFGPGVAVRNLRVTGERTGIHVRGATSASADVVDLVVHDTLEVGLMVGGDRATAVGRNLALRRARVAADGRNGVGVMAEMGAEVDLTRVVLDGNDQAGAAAIGEGTVLRLADCAARNTVGPAATGELGPGFLVGSGGRLEVQRSVVEGNRYAGVHSGDGGGSVDLADVVVRDTRPGSDGLGRGIAANPDTRVEARRVLLERNIDAAVSVQGAGASLGLTDAVVRRTRSNDGPPDLRGYYGVGLLLGPTEGAQAGLSRALFAWNREAGILANGDGVVVRATDLIVRDTMVMEASGIQGDGLAIQYGARGEIARGLFERNHSSGIAVAGPGASAQLADIVVRDTRSDQYALEPGLYGRGLTVEDGARVDLERALLERNREIGIAVMGLGASGRIVDVVVRETLVRECATTWCGDLAAGTGVGSFGNAHLELTRFEVSASALCGVQLARGMNADGTWSREGGTADLHDGIVRDNPIGANIQTEGFDVLRLMDRVLFIDNVRNFDGSALPVPSPTSSPP